MSILSSDFRHGGHTGPPLRARVPLAVLAFTGVALVLRLWQLDAVPPGLWWDEATQGLDAAELLAGQFRIFYPSALGKEPLYIYLTAPFVAAWFGSPFAVRLAGALLSVLMIPALCAMGRALFVGHPYAGVWSGLAAAALWATNFWTQSISRIGFQVNAFPLLLTVAALTWLNYVRRPVRRRALTFGIVAGLTLYTYLAARFTPVLWLVLFLLLPRMRQRALRPTLWIAILAFVVVGLPLGIHFALHPADFLGRISTFGAVQGEAAAVKPETLQWATSLTLKTFLGLVGDPIARHNLPDQPSFTPIAAGLFAVGLVTSLLAIIMRRHQGALTVVLWWILLCIPAILSRSSTPHTPRLFGALPAAILIASLPIGFLAHLLHHRRRPWLTPLLAVLLAALLAFETVHTAQAYFIRWARETDLYAFFQQDLWTIGEQISGTPDAIGVVALNEGFGRQLDYAFADTPIFQLPATEPDVASWLDARFGRAGGQQVIAVVWGEGANQDADPTQLLPYYLAREGSFLGARSFRGFELRSYRLSERPQFNAVGQTETLRASFESGLTLVAANWGAAYPNASRSSPSVAAGTPLWVVLTWRLGGHTGPPLRELRTAVDLLDPAGHRLTSAEAPLMDLREQQGPWQPGSVLRTYYLVTAPTTQPPGAVTLAARVYNTQTSAPILLVDWPSWRTHRSAPTLPVDQQNTTCVGCTQFMAPFAQPTVTPSLTQPMPDIARPLNHTFSSGVTLLGADEWPGTVAPGQVLSTRLFWRVEQPSSAARLFRLTLGVGADTQVRPYSAEMQIPAGLTPSAVVHTYADLRIPPDASTGGHTILLEDLQGDQVELGPVQVGGRPRVFQLPALAQSLRASFGDAVELRGIDTATSLVVAPGEVVTVTLVWSVVHPPVTDLARFVHVLGPGERPVTQRAGLPCAGQEAPQPDIACPAASWIPGEVLIDRIELVMPDDLPPGRYPLATGWYDPATMQRVVAHGAQGESVADDLLRLPVELVVGH